MTQCHQHRLSRCSAIDIELFTICSTSREVRESFPLILKVDHGAAIILYVLSARDSFSSVTLSLDGLFHIPRIFLVACNVERLGRFKFTS